MRYDDLTKMFAKREFPKEIPKTGFSGAFEPTPDQLQVILSERSVKEIQADINIGRDKIRQIRNAHGIYLTRGKKRTIRNCGETL